MRSVWLDGEEWLAVLRIGLGCWWLESWRHKDRKAWLARGSGIAWAGDIAGKHRWPFVRQAFTRVVAPRPCQMAYLIVYAELCIGLGVVAGFLTPIALAASIALNLTYFVLMIHDWAEQGQNAMMALIAIVCLFAQANQVWSIDHVLHLFGT